MRNVAQSVGLELLETPFEACDPLDFSRSKRLTLRLYISLQIEQNGVRLGESSGQLEDVDFDIP